MKRILMLSFLAACSAAPGCASAPSEEALGEDLAPLVDDRVVVLDPGKVAELETTPTAIRAPLGRFPELASRTAGDVLVSGAGQGLARRVLGVRTEGDRIVVDTEAASFADVFKQGRIRATIGGAEGQGGGQGGGLRPQAVRLVLPKLSISSRRLEIGTENYIDLVDAEFELEPKVDFDLLVRWRRVERLKLVASGASHAKAHVRYHLKKSLAPGDGFFVNLGNGVPAGLIPFPIVIAFRLRLLAGWNLRVGGDAEGEQQFSADGAATVGLEWRDEAWHSSAARSLSLRGDADHHLASFDVMGEVNLTARLDVSFYEVAGPYLGLQAYGGLLREGAQDRPEWFAVEGMRGLAGAQVAVFGRALVGYESVVFDESARQPL
jgi:hypothetical protein